MALLTSRALATGVTGTDLIHIVITGDTSQNPAGSSYKAEIDQVKNYLSTFFVSLTGNTSGNCITDLYVRNLYGCSPITINDSLQNSGSTSSGNTSHAFGFQTNSLGDFSHSEGSKTNTGQYGYNSTSIVSGVITLDVSYGDVTSQFSGQIILDDLNYDDNYDVAIFDISSVGYTTATIIYLVDTTVNTTQAHIGVYGIISPANSDVVVGGHYSHSEGVGSSSVGISSHSEGNGTLSVGYTSHSEGSGTISKGFCSHSEGIGTQSVGDYSHAEGESTQSLKVFSHSEGSGTIANGDSSHSEGSFTQTIGNYSHTEGGNTMAVGDYSHAEGRDSVSNGGGSHSEGLTTRTYGDYSHSEGSSSQSHGAYSHSEGQDTYSIGEKSHSEGYSSKTGHFGYYSNSIFSGVITLDAALGDVSSQIFSTVILDDFNYDNIYNVKLFDISSVIFNGINTVITLVDSTVNTTQANIGDLKNFQPISSDRLVGGYNSHSEGSGTESLGVNCHSEGINSIAVGIGSHAQGGNTKSIGQTSFASGEKSSAIGTNSFVHSFNSTVNGNNSVVLGGSGIIGNDDNTVYVPYFNIRDLGTGTSVNNLGIDSLGNVVVGSSGGTLTPPVTLSGIGMTVLTLIGSGDTVPVFSVQGSSGQLFSVTDSLIGSLFSVNDISGLPVLEVFSDNTILMGDYNSPSLNTTIKVTAGSGLVTPIYSIPTSAYTGAFFDYTVGNGTDYRAGNIMSVWDGSTAQYMDSYTSGGSPEIGTTSDIVFSVSISGGYANLVATTTSSSWDVKVIVRSI